VDFSWSEADRPAIIPSVTRIRHPWRAHQVPMSNVRADGRNYSIGVATLLD